MTVLEDLPYFKQHLHEDLDRVNVVINQAVKSDVALISQISAYIISAGGKRLRPTITILAGKAVEYDDERLHSLAAMVEFIHTSTLLHNNVADENDLRRGRGTANNLFGNVAAVLVGDFLYTRAFQLIVAPGSMKILEAMVDAANIIAEDEVMQLMNIGNADITEKQYIQVIQYKTAKLFEVAAQVGAILGGANPAQEQALKDYGMYVGTAFQIIDDVLDYSGEIEEIGKGVGDDLAEDKLTLPLIYLMYNDSKRAARDVRLVLENADRSYFEKVHDYVVSSNALPYAINEACKAMEKAVACLDILSDNEITLAMRQLAEESSVRVSQLALIKEYPVHLNVIPLFLVLLILLGVLNNNSSITISATVLLLMQQTALSQYLPLAEKYGIAVGIIFSTIGVLSPLVSGKIQIPSLTALMNFKMFAIVDIGILVVWIAGYGIPLMSAQPILVTGLLVGIIIDAAFLGGVSVGPLIVAGLLSFFAEKIQFMSRRSSTDRTYAS